jgi:hypothetical protein
MMVRVSDEKKRGRGSDNKKYFAKKNEKREIPLFLQKKK